MDEFLAYVFGLAVLIIIEAILGLICLGSELNIPPAPFTERISNGIIMLFQGLFVLIVVLIALLAVSAVIVFLGYALGMLPLPPLG